MLGSPVVWEWPSAGWRRIDRVEFGRQLLAVSADSRPIALPSSGSIPLRLGPTGVERWYPLWGLTREEAVVVVVVAERGHSSR